MNTLDQATASMIQNLEAKTGKSLADWIELARAAKIGKQRELLNQLKAAHGLSYGYANFIALKALDEVAARGCDELWLNPGSDSPEMLARAKELGLPVIQACSIVALGVSPAQFGDT